jgi:hypothetical protein
MNKKYTSIYQRRAFLLSAFFPLFFLTFNSCKKPESKIGAEVYDPNELLDAKGVDTFQLVTYSIIKDSSRTNALNTMLLGSYNDPIFGQVDASFFGQFRIAENNPDFGDLSQLVVDSMILSLNYLTNYGDANAPQKYEVYALAQDLSIDQTYYAFSSVDSTAGSLVLAGHEIIQPNVFSPTIIVGDTLNPQLRISLDTNYARSIITSGSGVLTDNTAFLQSFKGFLIKTNNPGWSSGAGSVLTIDASNPDTKITIYYKQAGVAKEFNLILSDASAYFNRVKFQNAGTPLKTVLNDSTMGAYEFYAQANLVKAKVDFPTISNLGQKTIIHRASLYLPISYFEEDEFYPSAEMQATTLFDGIGEIGVTTAQYSSSTKRYIFSVTNYIQAIVGGNYKNHGLIIGPKNFGNSAERVIFNGSKTPNKMQPKLIITYTEF